MHAILYLWPAWWCTIQYISVTLVLPHLALSLFSTSFTWFPLSFCSWRSASSRQTPKASLTSLLLRFLAGLPWSCSFCTSACWFATRKASGPTSVWHTAADSRANQEMLQAGRALVCYKDLPLNRKWQEKMANAASAALSNYSGEKFFRLSQIALKHNFLTLQSIPSQLRQRADFKVLSDNYVFIANSSWWNVWYVAFKQSFLANCVEVLVAMLATNLLQSKIGSKFTSENLFQRVDIFGHAYWNKR